MNTSRAKKYLVLLPLIVVAVLLFTMAGNLRKNAYAQNLSKDTPAPQQAGTETPFIEVVSPYFSIEHRTLPDGTSISGYIINGPPAPPPGYEAERAASMVPIPDGVILPNFPSFSWVFGCSAVSGAMIATYYDRGSYPNMYAGPTNGGVMPLSDTSWSTWSDGYVTYPNNPLIASHINIDGRGAIKGSIDDYWVKYNSTASDPYITGHWPQHTWGTAIGDFMKTSQSAAPYNNTDGSTKFYNFNTSSEKLTCSIMVDYGIDDEDGTYGRKLFYEARGYAITDCYNQNTDNNFAGGFSLANFQAEINAGYPVMLNLDGHTIVGYGYDGSTIYIRDTWDNDPSHTYTMPWGGSYQGMELLSVSVVHLAPSNPGTSVSLYLPIIGRPMPPTPTRTPISTVTRTPTRTPTGMATQKLTVTPTRTVTRTPTRTPTPPSQSWEILVNTTFEGDFPGLWDVFDNDGTMNGEYFWASRNCQAYEGTKSGWAVGGGANGNGLSCGNNYPNDTDSWMVYGPFSLVNATAAELDFKLWANTESGYDFVCSMASINGTNYYGNCGSGNSEGWIERTFDLSNVYNLGDLRGQPQVWVAIIFTSNFSDNYPEGAYVDNIVLRRCMSPTCTGLNTYQQENGNGQLIEKTGQATIHR